jgi:cephalosporin-C deacetylase-like acetyl esterase
MFVCVALTFANHCAAQEKTASPVPDYRVRIEVQHTDFATARANFKTQIRRSGPPPAQWDDVVTPAEATEVTYNSGPLRLKAWLSAPRDLHQKSPAVLFLHAGFDFYQETWDFVRPLRDAGYIVMLKGSRHRRGSPSRGRRSRLQC